VSSVTPTVTPLTVSTRETTHGSTKPHDQVTHPHGTSESGRPPSIRGGREPNVRLREQRPRSSVEATASIGRGFVDAQAVADYLGVTRSYIYEHAVELGARRLGTGPKARLRFSLEDVEAAVSCSQSRGPVEAEIGTATPSRRRRRQSDSGTSVPLLPIRGVEAT